MAGKNKTKNRPVVPDNLRQGLKLLGIILLVTLSVYLPSLKNTVLYGWDDGLYLGDEYFSHFSFDSIRHFFTTAYLGMYQPLALVSLAGDKMMYAENAGGYHLTSLIFHLLNIFLAFLFIFFLTRNIRLALPVALLFAIHPMHVEAVSWIAARSTLIFTLFYLAALIFYLRYLEQQRWSKLGITFLWFILACFSKSMAVTLPMILLLLDYFKGRKFDRRTILEKVPFFAVSVIFGIVSIKAAGTYGHIESLSASYSLIDRFFLLTYGISLYLFKAFIPVNLSAIYGYPFLENGRLPVVFYLSPLLIAGIVIMVIYLKKYRKEMIFGLLFFLLSISIVLPFYWSRIFIAAERYTYPAYLGLYFIITFLINKLFEKQNFKIRKFMPYFITVLIIIISLLIYDTVNRTKAWKNTAVLLTDVVEKPHNTATLSYGYYFRANYYDMTRDYNKSLADYDRAIGLNPGFTLAYNNRGIARGTKGDYRGAVDDFTKAIELKPDYADAFYNRGLAYWQLGKRDLACQDWQDADRLGSPSAMNFIRENCNR